MRKLLVLIALALPLSAQQNFDGVEIKATKVGGSVYMLTGAGGNIGVSVGSDGIVLIDDQFAPLAPKIEKALREISDKPLRFILNTHYHGDHTGGNEAFGRQGTIIAHKNVRKRLASGTKVPGRETPPAPEGALPIITFDASLTVHLNGEDIRAVHFPSGHTDGDSVIYFTKSNVIHMGDDFFNGSFPFVDIDGGGSVRGLISNVEYIAATMPADAKLIPGHGEIGDKAALQKYLEMLKATRAIAEEAVKAGKALDQMKSEKILAAWDSWGKGFVNADRYLGTLHRELGGK